MTAGLDFTPYADVANAKSPLTDGGWVEKITKEEGVKRGDRMMAHFRSK